MTWNSMFRLICVALAAVFVLVARERMISAENAKEKHSTDTLDWFLAAATMTLLPRIKSFSFGGYSAELYEPKEEVKQAPELAMAAYDLG